MTTKTPPIPPDNRSPHEHGSPSEIVKDDTRTKMRSDSDKTGQEANTRQNTTHQGYQQDR